MKKFLLTVVVILATLLFRDNVLKGTRGFSTKDLNEQLVLATLWMQSSAEYRALCHQAFNVAKTNLDQYLASGKNKRKAAIIVDADETVIDNSAYEAHLIGKEYGYTSKTWEEWMAAAQAKAVPGAVEFLNYARKKNIEVFYITNRKITGYRGTKENLKKLGFPFVDRKHLMLRDKSKDKQERRKRVLAEYDVVLYIGDNLTDFKSEFGGKSVRERFSLTDKEKNNFGKKFIVLPNPIYGEWEGALYKYNWSTMAAEKDNMRKKNLRPWNYSDQK